MITFGTQSNKVVVNARSTSRVGVGDVNLTRSAISDTSSPYWTYSHGRSRQQNHRWRHFRLFLLAAGLYLLIADPAIRLLGQYKYPRGMQRRADWFLQQFHPVSALLVVSL